MNDFYDLETTQCLREDPDVKKFYSGMSDEGGKSSRDVCCYRRRKRWLTGRCAWMRTAFSATCAAVLMATSSQACHPNTQADLKSVLEADAIIHGRVSDVEFLESSRSGNAFPAAILTFHGYNLLYSGKDPTIANQNDGGALRVLTLVGYFEAYLRDTAPANGLVAVIFGRENDQWIDAFDIRAFNDDLDGIPRDIPQLAHDVCDAMWLFDQHSPIGRALFQIFDGEGDRDAEIEVLATYLRMTGNGAPY